MENTAKAIIALIFVFLSANCKSDTPDSSDGKSTGKQPQSVSPTIPDTKRYLRENLFIDSLNIYLKVKNRGLRHPSSMGKKWPDSIYLTDVYNIEEEKYVALKSIVDTQSFKQVNSSGSYHIDSLNIYTYSVRPLPNQFFVHSRKGAKFIGCNKDYLLYKGLLYYQGYKVDGFENSHVEVLNYAAEDRKSCYDFIENTHSLYYAGLPLTMDRLGFIEDLSEKVKKDILTKYRLKIKESD
jgi:hypothetical protein